MSKKDAIREIERVDRVEEKVKRRMTYTEKELVYRLSAEGFSEAQIANRLDRPFNVVKRYVNEGKGIIEAIWNEKKGKIAKWIDEYREIMLSRIFPKIYRNLEEKLDDRKATVGELNYLLGTHVDKLFALEGKPSLLTGHIHANIDLERLKAKLEKAWEEKRKQLT